MGTASASSTVLTLSTNKNTAVTNLTPTSTSGTKYGTLYNYCAASAKTICTDSNSSNASYDICPAGWRLPTGGSSGEFQTLYNNSSYNSYTKIRAPISSGGAAFALAGKFYDGSLKLQGNSGFYWSSIQIGTVNYVTVVSWLGETFSLMKSSVV